MSKSREKSKEDKGFRPSQHVLVPKHEILPSEEAKKVLEKYNVKPEQLPYMLASDPMARELGAKPGDIIKITRPSPTSGTTVYYRYVVEG